MVLTFQVYFTDRMGRPLGVFPSRCSHLRAGNRLVVPSVIRLASCCSGSMSQSTTFTGLKSPDLPSFFRGQLRDNSVVGLMMMGREKARWVISPRLRRHCRSWHLKQVTPVTNHQNNIWNSNELHGPVPLHIN